ncbi:kinetochore protein Spc25-like [Branchiostoma lanceolatum]|uniref:kinetochore protein Spc25-like n=1 Tax=Branchiostoma lanceolatum TaxID=7740 RepID=UPI003456E3D1
MMLGTELQNLDGNLKQVQETLLNKWTGEGLTKHLAQQKQQHAECMAQARADISKLEESVDSFRRQAENNKEAIQQRIDQMQTARQDIEKVKMQTEGMSKQEAELRGMIGTSVQQIAKEKELILAQDKVTKQKMEELQKAVVFFKDRLGLKFRKLDGGRLQFSFTLIDAKDPDRAFVFTLKVDSKYEVVDCDPKVSDLDDLVAKLNATNNLSAFVQTMRKRFKQLV